MREPVIITLGAEIDCAPCFQVCSILLSCDRRRVNFGNSAETLCTPPHRCEMCVVCVCDAAFHVYPAVAVCLPHKIDGRISDAELVHCSAELFWRNTVFDEDIVWARSGALLGQLSPATMLTLVADADRAVGVHRCAFLAWLLLWAIYVLFAPAGILDACGAAAAPAASDVLAFGHCRSVYI